MDAPKKLGLNDKGEPHETETSEHRRRGCGTALTGTVLAVRAGPGGNPNTVAAGTVKATNNVIACSAISGGGGLCTIKLSGDYFDFGLLGNGKYTGTVTIDWSTYTVNYNDNDEMCASASGTLTFTTGSSVLKTAVIGASDFSQSFICESNNGQGAFDRDYFFGGGVLSGTGRFSKLNKSTSNLGMNGQEFAQLNAAQTAATGLYLDSPNINANLNGS